MGLSDRLRDLYHYKIKTVFDLASRGEFGYLGGVISEKTIGRNVYLEYLRHRGHDLTVNREIMGHTMTLDLIDPGLSRYLISRGVNEPNATPAFLDALETAIASHESDQLAVLDIGANIGYFALLEAELLGDRGTVYAFEPAPSNCELLKRNVRQNRYGDRVEIRQSAIGNRNGSAELILSDHSNWHRIATEQVAGGTDTITVDSRRVDSFLTGEGVAPETVVGIRMDVEGYEAAIFDGIGDFLDAKSPAVLFVELHPTELSKPELNGILSQLSEGGFAVQFAGQNRKTFDVDDPEAVAAIGGSHIRLVLRRS